MSLALWSVCIVQNRGSKDSQEICMNVKMKNEKRKKEYSKCFWFYSMCGE